MPSPGPNFFLCLLGGWVRKWPKPADDLKINIFSCFVNICPLLPLRWHYQRMLMRNLEKLINIDHNAHPDVLYAILGCCMVTQCPAFYIEREIYGFLALFIPLSHNAPWAGSEDKSFLSL